MKTKTILNTMMAICIAITLNGCAGKDGAPGATGPQGPTGNANVTSYSYIVNTGNWNTVGTSGNAWSVTTTLSVPTIDLVTAYVSPNGTTYLPLPESSYFANGDNLTFDYQTSAGLTFFYYNPASAAPTATIYVNVFVVPPAIMKQHPNTNWKDYSQVQAIINSEKANQ
jgi:hypothetical protein